METLVISAVLIIILVIVSVLVYLYRLGEKAKVRDEAEYPRPMSKEPSPWERVIGCGILVFSVVLAVALLFIAVIVVISPYAENSPR